MNIELKINNSVLFFTEKEWDIIRHRLEVPDAIVEAMTDCPADEPVEFTREEIYAAVDEMMALETRLHDRENLSDCFKAVLVDCCDGSTYLSVARSAVDCGDMTRSKLAGLTRVANSLEAKVEQLTGCRVRIPRS